MNTLMPNTVSVSDIQKNYRKIFDRARRTKEPIVILSNNKPDVVIMDIESLDLINKRLEEFEIEDTLRAIEQGNKEYKEGKTVTADSILDLLK